MDLEKIRKLGEGLYHRLHLPTFPVSITYIKTEKEIPEGTIRPSAMGQKWSLCQAITYSRRHGWHVAMTADDNFCVPASAFHKWVDVSDEDLIESQVRQGWHKDRAAEQNRFNFFKGLFAGPGGEQTLKKMKEHIGFVSSPLPQARMEPHTVIVYGDGTHINHMIQALCYEYTMPVMSTFEGFGETCFKGGLAPFITGRPQIVIPGMGDRAFAGITPEELAIGIPASQLDPLVRNLFKSGGDLNIGQPLKTLLPMGLTESITPGFAFLKEKIMQTDIYRQLQKQLDQYSMGFPETKSGIELKILQYLFSKEDAEVFTAMTPMLESAETVASRLNRPVADIADQLDGMAEKGLMFRLKKGTGSKYGAIPFVHGLFEFQVKNLKPDFVQMAKQYFDEAFDQAMQASADYFLRVIPVQESIGLTHQVASYEDAVEILKSKPFIVVTDCICRKTADLIDHDCGKPLEACFMFGSMGQYYLDRGMGRKISLEEAVDILKKCREAGLVAQPATAQNPAGMCNCCGDCCGVLRALNKHPKPAEIVFSNYFAEVGIDECTGCEICLDRCQMNAISLNDDSIAVVNKDRCIGCGLCVTTCPTEAIQLVLKSDAEIRIPPATMAEQMMLMAQKRGVI